MRRMMRSILVALLVAMLSFSPAVACNYCGSYGGGGYYSSGGYYGGYSSGGCCGGGYGDGSDGYYESSYGDSCCGGEVVVSEGCGDCGGCGDVGGCGCESDVATPENVEPPMAAPEAPLHDEVPTPSTVNRMTTDPAPSLPPQALPSTDTEMHAMPPVEPTTEAPAALPEERYTPETPAVEPTTPPAETGDDLFSTPSTESAPLPVEEPATPSEADDFFSEPATEPATDSTTTPPAEATTEPVTEPAADPAAPPTDDDLFAPPAEETPAEEATPPAEEEKAENDDLFGNTDAILEMPGGLASHSLRQWVDNTGGFSCKGRMLRMMDGKVQLLKDNGRTTTVSLARLSQGDLEFVNRQASAQKTETLGKTAQASNAWSK